MLLKEEAKHFYKKFEHKHRVGSCAVYLFLILSSFLSGCLFKSRPTSPTFVTIVWCLYWVIKAFRAGRGRWGVDSWVLRVFFVVSTLLFTLGSLKHQNFLLVLFYHKMSRKLEERCKVSLYSPNPRPAPGVDSILLECAMASTPPMALCCKQVRVRSLCVWN